MKWPETELGSRLKKKAKILQRTRTRGHFGGKRCRHLETVTRHSSASQHEWRKLVRFID